MVTHMYKKAILIVVTGVAASFFWFWAKPWLDNPARFSDYSIWLKPLISLTALACAIGVSLLLLKTDRISKIILSVAVGLPFMVIFGFDKFYISAVILMILLHMYASSNINAEAIGI